MIPGIFNIEAYRNDTMTYTITITDENGAAVNLSTAAVKMEVRTKADGDVLMTLTEGDGLNVGGAGNNIVTISKVVTIDNCGSYYYDLQAAFSSGVVSTYIRGAFTVIKDITT